ncbi:MAG: hypothetical protein Phog2KO_44390 [Phototrophicaceae bacterium]
MAKFAVYTIPSADSTLYQRGSELLGYDVRTGEFIPEDNPTRRMLPEFDTDWVKKPQTYGFHMTTGYSLFYEPAILPQIEAEIETVIACFSNHVNFELAPATDPIPFWRDNIAVLHFEPNPAMLMLHTMLTARVNPYGTSSTISETYAKMNPQEIDPIKAIRVQKFYTPHILDSWTPHFSLMYPYTGQNPTDMKEALLQLFPPKQLSVETICLLIRDDKDTHYRLYREFKL